MRILALDIGRRRTGVAFAESDVGVPIALDTIQHKTEDELIVQTESYAKEKQVDELLLGLPLLPTGIEGDQVDYVRSCGEIFTERGWKISYLDERYTTDKKTQSDGDARAACELLLTFLQRNH